MRVHHLFKISICSLAFGLTPLHSLSQGGENPVADLEKQMQHELKAHGLEKDQVGMYLRFADGSEIKSNEHRKMIPASVTKIATAGSFLEVFSGGLKLKTQILGGGSITKGVLKGNIYLKGGGDPSFVSENMWFLVNAFLRTGITKVDGDIVVDDSLFDSKRFDDSRESERVDRAYDAPVGAMSFNWNSSNIFVRPGAKVGDPASVWLDPENEYLKLRSNVKTVRGATSVHADRVEGSDDRAETISVGGSIGVDSKEVVIFKNITRPDLWSGQNLKSFLGQRGVGVTGKVTTGVTPGDAKPMAEYESKPFEQILSDMDKFSNNFVAEMICKNLGIAQGDKQGSIKGGIQFINDYLRKIGIPGDEYEIYNPSGLTRNNKMSPFALWKILDHLQKNFKNSPEFIASLPIAGVDGTLKKRFKNSNAVGLVRAKTGSLNGVVSLAGYAGRGQDRPVAFAFIYNGSRNESEVREVFDHLSNLLVEYNP